MDRNTQKGLNIGKRKSPAGRIFFLILCIPLLSLTNPVVSDVFGGWFPPPPIINGALNHSENFFPTEGDLGDERIVTAGLGIKTADESSFVIRSYEAHTGSLISEDEFELSVDEETADVVEEGEGRIYAVGSGLNDRGTLSLLIRAYDAQTGHLLWEDDLNPSGEKLLKTTSLRTILHKKISEGEGHLHSQPNSQSSYLVQAIDSQTGELVWKDEFFTGSKGQSPDKHLEDQKFPTEKDVEKTFSIRIRTYDMQTGTILWHDELSSTHENNTGLGEESGIDKPRPEQENAVNPRLQVRFDSNHGQKFADRSLQSHDVTWEKTMRGTSLWNAAAIHE